MKEKTTKELGEDMLRFLIKLYEDQEQIKITYEINEVDYEKETKNKMA